MSLKRQREDDGYEQENETTKRQRVDESISYESLIHKQDIDALIAALNQDDKIRERIDNCIYDGNNLLHKCCIAGYVDVAKILIQSFSASPFIPNAEKLTPIELAAKYGRYPVLDFLFTQSFNAENDAARCLVRAACAQQPSIFIVLSLLKRFKYSLLSRKFDGDESVLSAIIEHGNLEVIRAMLDGEQSVEMQRLKSTVLCTGARKGRFEIVKFCIEELQVPVDDTRSSIKV